MSKKIVTKIADESTMASEINAPLKEGEKRIFTPSYGTHFRNVVLNMTYKCDDIRHGMARAGMELTDETFTMLACAEEQLTILLNSLDARSSAPLFHEKPAKVVRVPSEKTMERMLTREQKLEALKAKLNIVK